MSALEDDPLTPKSTLIKIDLTVTYTSERRGKENINWSKRENTWFQIIIDQLLHNGHSELGSKNIFIAIEHDQEIF